jgi:hypothetical protein
MTTLKQSSTSIDEKINKSDKKDVLKALVLGAADLQTKFGLDDWNQIEAKTNEFTNGVISCLIKLGNGDKSNTYLDTLQVIGEEAYVKHRDELANCKIGSLLLTKPIKKEIVEIKEIKKGKKGKKDKKDKKVIINKAAQIRLDNTAKKIKTEFSRVLDTFSQHKLTTQTGLDNCKILELRGVTLMYIAWFFINHPDTYNKPSKLVDIYEIIVGIKKFIKSAQGYIGKSMFNSINKEEISKTMFDDLELWSDKLQIKYEFSGFKLHKIAPRLAVYTIYDSIIPSKGITPRKNQVKLMNYIINRTSNKNIIDSSFLVSYKAMINSGKTTFAAIALPSHIKMLNERAKAQGLKQQIQLLFCCNLRSVMFQVANLAYNAGIKFALASITNDVVKIVNHFNCSNDAERVLIICSPDAAEIILKQDIINNQKTGDHSNYWLFLDEPTIGADQLGSDSLNKNISVMSYMPMWTILSSATMPDLSLLTTILDNHIERNPTVEIKTEYSNEIQIGCDVKTFDHDVVLPHLGCKTAAILSEAIINIEKNPFMGRMYTHNVIRKLWTEISNNCIGIQIPDLNEIFSDASNWYVDKVRQLCMDLLRLLTKQDDKIVEKICSSCIFESDVKETKPKPQDDDCFVFEDEVDPLLERSESKVDFDKIGTYDAHMYMNMNLIASTEPTKFAAKHFDTLLKELAKEGIDNSTRLIAKYERDMDIFKKSINRIEDRIKDEDKASQQIQQKEDMDQPKINFPDWAQINSLEHIKLFAKSHIKEINPSYVRSINPVEKLPLDSRVSDKYMLLLMAGVGIYAPSSKELDEPYLQYVLEAASTGNLAYLIADSSISYGTNYPINRVFVTKEFADAHSINTIFQLLGRTGRVGQSWMGEGLVPKEVAERIIKYVSNQDSDIIEVTNMLITFQKSIDDKIKNKIILEERKELSEKIDRQQKEEKEKKRKELAIKKIVQKLPDPSAIVSISSITKNQDWQHKFSVESTTNNKKSWRNESIKPNQYTPDMHSTNINNWRKKTTAPEITKPIDTKPSDTKGSYIPPHQRVGANTTKSVDTNQWMTQGRRKNKY